MARPHVVTVGAGFAGFHAARRLFRIARGRADITVVNPTDYFLYLPLLPGEADELDVVGRRVGCQDPTGKRDRLRYDRLVLAAGSVNRATRRHQRRSHSRLRGAARAASDRGLRRSQ